LSTKAIEVIGVSKRFGEIRAVDDVTLSVDKGELFGLIGHNGAGKSTLFKMMLGLLPMSSGDIRVNGRSVLGRDFRDVRRSVGYLPENVVLYDNLTGLETLQFFADLKGVDRSNCMTALARVGLKDAAGRRVRGYSKGMRQRLGFAQALLGSPAILFLDEPTSGLDPEGIREFYRILHDMRCEGVTAILTSHILAEIQERVDRLAMVKSGRIQAIGTVQFLREEMKLPVQLHVTPREGRLQALLGGLAERRLKGVEAGDGAIVLSCRRDRKMPVLDIVSSFSSDVADVQIREPSLEDVFLGYGAGGEEYGHECEHSL
jgi:Cu-processing system ATP-binding protein